jgi:hypothetical protein
LDLEGFADLSLRNDPHHLHRTGEGAPYTGVTDETTPQAILVAAKSMNTGSLDETYKLLNETMSKGVQEKYEAVVKAREEAEKLGTVEAHRERVEAELMFEKYVYELFSLASAAEPPAEGYSHEEDCFQKRVFEGVQRHKHPSIGAV